MIAAYVLPRDDASIDRTFIRNHLMSHLPVFMVPAFLDEVTAIPTLTSGKVDRKNLPAPKNRLAQESTEKVASANSLEELILKAWQQAFDREDLSVTENFFMDLGGHSLVAAQVTNILRAHQKFHAMSVADVYAFPTIRALANHRAAQGEDKYPSKPTRRSTFHASNRRYFICGFAQALGLVPIAGIYAWEWLGPYFVYAYLVLNKATTGQALAGALLTYFVTVPATMMIGVIAKWLILGRIKPGRYPLWGVYYYRFWFVRTLIRALPVGQLVGTPLLNFYYRLLGVKIGRGVYLGTANITSYDTVQVGKGTSIGSDASIDGTCVEDGWLKIRSVTIGNHCWLGHRTILGGNNKIDDGGQLDDLSSLPTGTHIGRGQKYSGSPAQHTGPSETSRRPAKRIWTTPATLALCVAIFSVPLMVSLSLAPGLLMMTYISHFDHWFHLFWGAPLAACSFVLCLCLVTIFVKWVMVGRLREGVYPIAGAYYVRKWFVDHVLSLSLDVIGTIYATLYIRPFFKLLGARLGARSEVSTVRSLQPDLLIAGPECFLADDISLGAPKIMSGWMELRQVQIGRRTFIGNSALLPAGSMIGDQILIGVLSRPPQQNPVPNGTSWLGASAILLPKREEAPQFSETQTYRPTGNLLALRYFIEFFRVILPSTLFIFVSALILHLIDHYHGIGNFGAHMLVLPFVYLAAGACGVLFVIALKWLLVGEYKPSKHPLWSHFVWRSELITGVYENFGVLFFLDLLRGTPFLPMTLRLFGMKIGSRCYLDTTWFTEFDLVFIGSDAMLNEDANIQTHLFEDRIFKLGKVKIGRRCSVGTMSTILYETEMKSGSKLGDLSLLMKGEMLPANTSWSGSPLQIE